MKTLRSFSIIAIISLVTGSLVACAASKTVSPTLTLKPSVTPTTIPTIVPTQTIQNDTYLQVFEEVWNTVNETFFDPEFGGINWNAVHEQYEPLIAAVKNDEELYQLLNQMLYELNVSHAGVGPAEGWFSAEPVSFEPGEIGIDLRLINEQAVIIRVKANSPAMQAGLRPGFIILSIDDDPIEHIIAEREEHLAPPYHERGRLENLTRTLLGLIYGEPGTCVTLTYLDGDDEPHTECIERIQRPRAGSMEGISLPPFYLEFESDRLDNGIGYIRFNTFHPDLVPEMLQAINSLQEAPGIIIDVRGNPGGDPTVAEELGAQFLDGQVLFGSFKARPGTMERWVTGKNIYPGPLIILIDVMSYSASEWFSAGMQVTGRAVVIGERSAGGESGMNIKILQNGAILGYPTLLMLAPDGTVLEGLGVTPDISVSLERSQLLQGIDAQMQAAIDYIVKAER